MFNGDVDCTTLYRNTNGGGQWGEGRRVLCFETRDLSYDEKRANITWGQAKGMSKKYVRCLVAT